MSLTVPLTVAGLPNRGEWQQEIDRLGLDMQLDPQLNLARDSGFSPATILGRESGFEIYVVEPGALATGGPGIAGRVPGPTRAISFAWRGDLAECACVLAAAAGLLQRWARVAVSDDDGMVYDGPALLAEFRACVTEL